MSTPAHLTLGELIGRLSEHDPDKKVAVGFGHPHSYRGYYHDVAFEIVRGATVGGMLAPAQMALGATYQAWKGGYYTMEEYSECWLVSEEGSCGESIGAVLLDYMLGEAS